ncbi:hypothetical protein PG989_016365 [Apiospora arundinis]
MDAGNNNTTQIILPTSNDVIESTAFYVLTWLFFGLCTIALFIRLYIRLACFRKLWYDDYLMLVAYVLHTAEAILIQLFLKDAYDLEKAERGDMSVMGPEFLPNSRKAFVALGTSINITMVGVLIIKLSFMLFFRRLGTNIRYFNAVWWGILLFTVAAAAAQIGMQDFGCFFADITYILSEKCTSDTVLHRIFINAIFSAIVDALSDFLIVGLPIAVLWRSRISRSKKLLLTVVFGLVSVTIAVTIVRGSVFHSSYTGSGKIQSATFTWFWFYCEFSVACIVSFRALFVQREKSVNAREEEKQQREAAYLSARRRGWRARARQMHDSVLDTFRSAEDMSRTGKSNGLPDVPSGLMTVNFEDDNNWGRNLPSSTTGRETNVSDERDSSSTGTTFKGSATTCEYVNAR